MTTNRCLHRFDTGFVPPANHSGDYIIVTRNSPLISRVSRNGWLNTRFMWLLYSRGMAAATLQPSRLTGI